ncbi:hypothetical protein Gotur_008952 [Gossypium turneri]
MGEDRGICCKRNVIAWPKDMCQSCGTLLILV